MQLPAPPLTLQDWTDAHAAGADPGALLSRHLEVLRARPDSRAVWISIATRDQLDLQLDALAMRARAYRDGPALRAAMPLYGVPYAVKDNIDVLGFETTAACPAFARPAGRDAAAVARLRAAGAICIGKTNLDQFATGLVGTRSPYGRPATPFDPARISGGSSSGSAVAVSTGCVPFALGTDTAGSGRVPAAFNRIVGLKPTPGRVGTSGVVPACRTLDCVSVFGLTVDDCAAVLAVIEGPDADDPYSRFEPGPARWPERLRIGVPKDARLDGAIGYPAAWRGALDRLAADGHAVEAIDFAPLLRVAALLYEGPWVAERHSAVRRLLDARPEAFDATVLQVIRRARDFSATDAFEAGYVLKAAARDAAALWSRFDALMVPTAPTHPTFAEVDADPLGANAVLGTFTNFVNLLGWSALAVPAADADALPFGVTFIAPGGHDAALAHWGARWQAASALPLGATGRRAAVAPARAAGRASPAVRRTLPVAVVGAHLSGLPLNGQLVDCGATLARATTTSANYRLHALPGTTPAKPGMIRATGGREIVVEVWDLPIDRIGDLLALIPPPLGLGNIELADGRWVKGFLCEPHALDGAQDISEHGGWRAWLDASRSSGPGG